jgi:TonB family protein
MLGAARTAPLTRSGPRPLPIGFSLLAHAGLLSFVALSPAPSGARRPLSLYDELIKPREHELVWYSFRQKLPEVSPSQDQNPQPSGVERELRDQTLVSTPKQGDRGAQMIWRPLPQIKPQPEIASPNILAFRLPLIQPPPPGPPRKVLVPPEVKPRKPTDPAPALPEPPKMPAKIKLNQDPALMASIAAALENRPKPRNFVPPVPKPEQRTAVQALPEAPVVATTLRSERVPLLAENMAAPVANKPQPRTFVPPTTPARPAAGAVTLPDAPKIATQLAYTKGVGKSLAFGDASAAALANKPKPHAFVAPPAVTRGGQGSNANAAAPVVQEAPSLDLAGIPSANVNVAIIGLNPAAKLTGPLPDTSREARFAAGPNANGGTGGAASASHSPLSVPGLLVRGAVTAQNPKPANPLLMARVAPTSREALEAAVKASGEVSADDPPSSEIHSAPSPDPEFNGRDVYTLAVQMPNITSYAGSWIMWFAERSASARRGSHGLRPPVPVHKVDPKYYQDAIAERVEGKVQLAGVIRADGHVDQVRVLKGVDPRLDRSAAEALLKWEFEPAQRNGAALDVDVVAEIPFLLAPQARP